MIVPVQPLDAAPASLCRAGTCLLQNLRGTHQSHFTLCEGASGALLAGLCLRSTVCFSPKLGVKEGGEEDASSGMLFHASASTEELLMLFY